MYLSGQRQGASNHPKWNHQLNEIGTLMCALINYSPFRFFFGGFLVDFRTANCNLSIYRCNFCPLSVFVSRIYAPLFGLLLGSTFWTALDDITLLASWVLRIPFEDLLEVLPQGLFKEFLEVLPEELFVDEISGLLTSGTHTSPTRATGLD